jgi:hypothetical protein
MGISVRVESEEGDIEAEVADPSELTQTLLPDAGDVSWSCLRFVDPSGATVFNRLQISALIGELQRRLGELDDPDIKDHLGEILQLVESAEGQQGTFVRFVSE